MRRAAGRYTECVSLRFWHGPRIQLEPSFSRRKPAFFRPQHRRERALRSFVEVLIVPCVMSIAMRITIDL